VNKTKGKTSRKRITVFGQEYACAYIGHACAAQLYAYSYYKYAYACDQQARTHTP